MGGGGGARGRVYWGWEKVGFFSQKTPMPCAKPPMVHEYTRCGWSGPPRKSCRGTPPTPPPPPPVRRAKGRFHIQKPIQHAARVGGP